VKIAAGLVAILIALLGMIGAIGHLDGSIILGDPPAEEPETVDSPLITGEEEAYLSFVVGMLDTVSSDINTLGILFSEPDFEDEYWQSSATLLLNRIEMGYDALVTVQVSPRLQPFHDAALRALDHSGEFARVIRGLLVAGSTQLNDEAATELLAAAEAFGEAEELLNGFLASHTLPE
jgi:hypothetical protein